MADRLFLERECEHGRMEPHGTCPHPKCDTACPGGSRREVTVDIQQAIRTFDDEYGNGEPEEWMARVVDAALDGDQ